jgi:hypothetical protein
VGIVTVSSQALTLAEGAAQLDPGITKDDPMKSKTIKNFFRKPLIIVTSHSFKYKKPILQPLKTRYLQFLIRIAVTAKESKNSFEPEFSGQFARLR